MFKRKKVNVCDNTLLKQKIIKLRKDYVELINNERITGADTYEKRMEINKNIVEAKNMLMSI